MTSRGRGNKLSQTTESKTRILKSVLQARVKKVRAGRPANVKNGPAQPDKRLHGTIFTSLNYENKTEWQHNSYQPNQLNSKTPHPLAINETKTLRVAVA